MTLEIYMKIIDEEDNNTRREIYKVIDETCFKEVTIFPGGFLEKCKKNPNVPQNIPNYMKKLKQLLQKKFVFAGCRYPV